MNKMAKMRSKILLLYPLAFVVLASMLFLPAGSLRYWQGWIFIAIILSCSLFLSLYFLQKSPAFLKRRMMFKEKEAKQDLIIKLTGIIFFLGFLIPGLDYRFGWSNVPLWLVIVSNIIIVFAYYLVFLAFKENAFAGRTVEVFEGQKVIDTGPYALVRHPMYAGVIPLFLFTPLALGSYWALVAFLPICGVVIIRALNEEEVLLRDLPGYNDYCKRVKYRLVPFIW